MAVEPVTRYRFADGSTVDLSADEERSVAGAGAVGPGRRRGLARVPGHLRGACGGPRRPS